VLLALLLPLVSPDLWMTTIGVALLTEILDGTLARRFQWVTPIGQIFDPVADRTFALSAGLTFMAAERILPAQLFLMLSRDIIVTIGFAASLVSLKTAHVIQIFKPNLWGKLTTAFQYLILYDILISGKPHAELVGLTAFASALAAILY
jgi:cardiolipin synthase